MTESNFELGSSPEFIDYVEEGSSSKEREGIEAAETEGFDMVKKKKVHSPSAKNSRIKTANLNIDPEDHVRQQVPKSTKKSTSYAVNLFNSTMKVVGERLNFQHQDLKDISVENLPWRLSKFLMVVSKSDGSSFNSSSLETIYASLARYLSTEYEPKLDIKNDVNFKTVKANLEAAQKESAQDGEGPGKHKSRPFKDEHIDKCWEKGSLGRSGPRSLLSTVYFSLISNFGFRANLEVYDIQNEDVIFGPEGKGGIPEWIEISERVTKTRRGGSHSIRDLVQKVFADQENPNTCPVRTMLEFRRRKTAIQNAAGKPYFWGVKLSAEKKPESEEFWYTNTRMGTHYIAKILPNVFESIGVDVKLEHYTNTSGRKTLLEGGIEAGIPAVLLSKVAGQAAFSSLQHYVKGQEKSHKAVSLCLSRKVGAVPGVKFDEIYGGKKILRNIDNCIIIFIFFSGVVAEDLQKRGRGQAEDGADGPDEIDDMFFHQDEDDDFGTTISQSRKTVTEDTVVINFNNEKRKSKKVTFQGEKGHQTLDTPDSLLGQTSLTCQTFQQPFNQQFSTTLQSMQSLHGYGYHSQLMHPTSHLYQQPGVLKDMNLTPLKSPMELQMRQRVEMELQMRRRVEMELQMRQRVEMELQMRQTVEMELQMKQKVEMEFLMKHRLDLEVEQKIKQQLEQEQRRKMEEMEYQMANRKRKVMEEETEYSKRNLKEEMLMRQKVLNEKKQLEYQMRQRQAMEEKKREKEELKFRMLKEQEQSKRRSMLKKRSLEERSQKSAPSPLPNTKISPSQLESVIDFEICASISCLAPKGEELLRVCSGCISVAYCGERCQVDGWVTHKKFCSRLKGQNFWTRRRLIIAMFNLDREPNREDKEEKRNDAETGMEGKNESDTTAHNTSSHKLTPLNDVSSTPVCPSHCSNSTSAFNLDAALPGEQGEVEVEEEGKEDEDAEGIVEREEEIQKKKDGFASSQVLCNLVT